MLSRHLNNPKPIWDTDYNIPIQLLDRVRVNGKSLREFSKSNKVRINNETIVISLKDLFGTLVIERPDRTSHFIVVPYKLFPRNYTPQQGEWFIKEIVFRDIGEFVSFIVKEIRDIQTYHVFKIIMKEYKRSVYFLVVALEYYLSELEEQGKNLFLQGPIHKETISVSASFGSNIRYSNSAFVLPYLKFHRRSVSYDTLLNKMLFQSFYYVIVESEVLKHIITDKDLVKRLETLQKRALQFIEYHHLWEFFYETPLDLMTLQEKIATQQNPYYARIFEIYKELVKIVFSKTILENINRGIQYPLLNFPMIYETWAIWRIIRGLIKCGFHISQEGILLEDEEHFKRKTKAIFMLEKDDKVITIVWELKFKPETDSLYMGSLVKAVGYIKEMPIKPDLILLISRKGEQKPIKVILGDVKFRVDKNKQLPPLESLYKVLGYFLDLKGFEHFKGVPIEGILIYPGQIEMLKIPIIEPKEKKNIFYINLIPLNSESFEIDLENLLN